MALKKALKNDYPYLIAECAYSFEGDKQYLLRQIKNLENSKIDAIKFHIMMDQDEYYSRNHPLYKESSKWLLSKKDWKEILEFGRKSKMDIIVLVDDSEVVRFLTENNNLVDGVEIHSACINDVFLLKEQIKFVKEYNKVFIAGISGLELDEILKLNSFLHKQKVRDVLFMYGFQNYPTKYEDVNLKRIKLLKSITKRKIGYADHTEYNDEFKKSLITSSFVLGSNIQEIHYVLKEGEKKIDYITAKDVSFLNNIKEELIKIHTAIRDNDFEMNEGERNYMKIRKSPVFKRDLNAGDIFSEDDIAFKRVDDKDIELKGIFEYSKLIGKKLCKNVREGEKVEYQFFY